MNASLARANLATSTARPTPPVRRVLRAAQDLTSRAEIDMDRPLAKAQVGGPITCRCSRSKSGRRVDRARSNKYDHTHYYVVSLRRGQ